MIAVSTSVSRKASNALKKEQLQSDLKNLLKKSPLNKAKIAKKAKVKRYEFSRAFNKNLGAGNESFDKLCNFATKELKRALEKELARPLEDIPDELRVAYTDYKRLGGKADRAVQVINFLAIERHQDGC